MSFAAGLFVGEDTLASINDNLDLERWFRVPKSHERRIHGHRHAGIRIVLEGPTLVHALDAHVRIRSRSRWPTCCRIARLKNREPNGGIEAPQDHAEGARRRNARYSWPTWSGVIANQRRFSSVAGRCFNLPPTRIVVHSTRSPATYPATTHSRGHPP